MYTIAQGVQLKRPQGLSQHLSAGGDHKLAERLQATSKPLGMEPRDCTAIAAPSGPIPFSVDGLENSVLLGQKRQQRGHITPHLWRSAMFCTGEGAGGGQSCVSEEMWAKMWAKRERLDCFWAGLGGTQMEGGGQAALESAGL